MHRTLNDIDDELGRAVFGAVYDSVVQRRRRRIALLLLVMKHLGRGLLVIWPLYIVLLALWWVPGLQDQFLYLLALAPGVIGWLLIYLRGIRREYSRQVAGHLLHKRDYKRLLLD